MLLPALQTGLPRASHTDPRRAGSSVFWTPAARASGNPLNAREAAVGASAARSSSVCYSQLQSRLNRAPRVLCAASTQQAAEVKLRVVLTGSDIKKMMSLEVVAKGKGQAVVVMDVQAGSPAFQAGVRPGQALVGISDPVRRGEMWQLGDRPSLKFVNEAIKLSRFSDVEMEFQDYLNTAPLPSQLAPGGAPSQPSPGLGSPATGSMASAGSMDGSMDAGSSLGSLGSMEEGQALTIGERMALDYERRQQIAAKASEVKKRIERRKSYMEEVDKRNDSPFLLGLFAFFVVPPAAILAIAYFSGYLDSMYSNSLSPLQ